jgi:hypothetical protein
MADVVDPKPVHRVTAMMNFASEQPYLQEKEARICCQFGAHPRIVWMTNRSGLLSIDLRVSSVAVIIVAYPHVTIYIDSESFYIL